MLFHSALSDVHIELLDLIAEDDRVVVHFNFRGTHDGELAGIPPTGRQLSVGSVGVARIRDGKVVEEIDYFDNLTILQQLGVEMEP